MMRYLVSRLFSAVPTLWLLITLTFFMTRFAPGGPFDFERSLPPDIEAQLLAQYHLDENLLQQYLRYFGDLLSGDLGPSFQYRDYRVSELIAQGLPVSLLLGGLAMLLATVGGLLAGIYAALKHGRAADTATMSFAAFGISIPAFVLAPLLIWLVAIQWNLLPAGGWNGGHPAWLVLPVLTLAVPQLAYIARLVRSSMLDVLQEDFIRTARAKGLSLQRIVLVHALRPALLPVVSYLGPATAAVLTGSVVIEQIFGIPGLGRFFVQGALNRDYTLVMGVVILYGTLVVLFNLLVDLAYAWLDPRVRLPR